MVRVAGSPAVAQVVNRMFNGAENVWQELCPEISGFHYSATARDDNKKERILNESLTVKQTRLKPITARTFGPLKLI